MTRDKIIRAINDATIEVMTSVAEKNFDENIDNDMEMLSRWAEKIRQMVPETVTDVFVTIESLEVQAEDIVGDDELGQVYLETLSRYLDCIQMYGFHDAVRQRRKS